MLTVAIPTYNRPNELRETLKKILPQIQKEERCHLLILDNHSDVRAQAVYEELNIVIPKERISIVRNSVNIGMGANFMRCFELCTTDYLWLLGDDDHPVESAVEVILADVDKEASFAYYSVPSLGSPSFSDDEPDIVTGHGFEELNSRFYGDYLRLAFISTSIFRVKSIRDYLKSGFSVSPSLIPHVMMVMKSQLDGDRWMISRRSITEWKHPDKANHWGLMSFIFSTGCLLSEAATIEEITLIRKYMMQGLRPSPKVVLYSLIIKYEGSCGFSAEVRYLLRVLKAQYALNYKDRLQWDIAMLWSFFPDLFKMYRERKSKKTSTCNGNSDRV